MRQLDLCSLGTWQKQTARIKSKISSMQNTCFDLLWSVAFQRELMKPSSWLYLPWKLPMCSEPMPSPSTQSHLRGILHPQPLCLVTHQIQPGPWRHLPCARCFAVPEKSPSPRHTLARLSLQAPAQAPALHLHLLDK